MDNRFPEQSRQIYQAMSKSIRRFWIESQRFDLEESVPAGSVLSRCLFEPARWGFIPPRDRKGLFLARQVGLQNPSVLEQFFESSPAEPVSDQVLIKVARSATLLVVTTVVPILKQASQADLPADEVARQIMRDIRQHPRRHAQPDLVWQILRFLIR